MKRNIRLIRTLAIIFAAVYIFSHVILLLATKDISGLLKTASIALLVSIAFAFFTVFASAFWQLLLNDSISAIGTIIFLVGSVIGVIYLLFAKILHDIATIHFLPIISSISLASIYRLDFLDKNSKASINKERAEKKQKRDKEKIRI